MSKWTLLTLCSLLALFIQDYKVMRKEMVNEQIIKRGISNADVINAFEKVPRHLFVPVDLRSLAYEDRPLPIGYNQTISQPYIVAYMTEQLRLKQDDKVLEIGTGSGYQAAILAEIVNEVYTIEIVKALGLQAAAILDSLGYSNIHCRVGDGYNGWPTHQPYDAIILTAAPEKIPQPLFEQLKEGGRLIAPVDSDGYQQLVLYTKSKGLVKRKELIGVRFVPFIH